MPTFTYSYLFMILRFGGVLITSTITMLGTIALTLAGVLSFTAGGAITLILLGGSYFAYVKCRRLRSAHQINEHGIRWPGLGDETIPWDEVQEIWSAKGYSFYVSARGNTSEINAYATTNGDRLQVSLRQWCSPLVFREQSRSWSARKSATWKAARELLVVLFALNLNMVLAPLYGNAVFAAFELMGSANHLELADQKGIAVVGVGWLIFSLSAAWWVVDFVSLYFQVAAVGLCGWMLSGAMVEACARCRLPLEAIKQNLSTFGLGFVIITLLVLMFPVMLIGRSRGLAGKGVGGT